ncbi:MAG TPA: glycosyltransferase family 4 protein [Dehalococcoidia bacterium]
MLFYAHGDVYKPSSRERLFKLLPLLRERGVDAVVPPLERSVSARTLVKDLRLLRQADVVFIQKRLMLPHYVSLLRFFRPLVYDFDDAMYASWPRFEGPPSTAAVQLSRYRLLAVLKTASVVIAGNPELAEFASRHSRAVRVVPTSVTTYSTPRQHCNGRTVTIGWIGTDGNLGYLDRMPAILARLNDALDAPVRLRVVCSRPAPIESPYVDFQPWSLADDEGALSAFDIGIMPLPDNDWTRGKCGFKLLQYASAGLPVVASPVGANRDVVLHGETGFLAESDGDWVARLAELATDPRLRQRMGEAARERAMCLYSPQAAADSLAQAIRSAAPAGVRTRSSA